jgi:DNA-binding transcriptional LysR family regulator
LLQGIKQISKDNPRPSQGLSTLESFHPLVALGKGIVILPEGTSKCYSSELCRIPLSDPELIHNVVIVYKKNNAFSSAEKFFLEEIEHISLSQTKG